MNAAASLAFCLTFGCNVRDFPSPLWFEVRRHLDSSWMINTGISLSIKWFLFFCELQVDTFHFHWTFEIWMVTQLYRLCHNIVCRNWNALWWRWIKWNGVRHAKQILIFGRNYADTFMQKRTTRMRLQTAKKKNCTLWRHNERCIQCKRSSQNKVVSIWIRVDICGQQ